MTELLSLLTGSLVKSTPPRPDPVTLAASRARFGDRLRRRPKRWARTRTLASVGTFGVIMTGTLAALALTLFA